MILPERVLGSSVDDHDLARLGDQPTLGYVVTQLRHDVLALVGVATQDDEARTRPDRSSHRWRDDSAASATLGVDTRADSTSVVEMR